MSLDRLSLNQFTTRNASLEEAAAACARAGIPSIGLWREHVEKAGGPAAAAQIVAEAGLRVSSLCRGGFLTASDPQQRAVAIADNRLAIEEAAGVGAPCLVLVVGGLPAGSTDLAGARAAVLDALDELAPYAGELGVQLALEALHPMYCADRAVLSTLAQALDWAERFPVAQVGVVVDTFHLWWDPELLAQIERAGERISSYQVSDWVTPLPADVLLGRGMMGDGHIDFAPITAAVEAAGYRGDIEVEIFNQEIWDTAPDTVLATMSKRYLDLIVR